MYRVGAENRSRSTRPWARMIPWLYSIVVLGSMTASCLVDASVEGLFCVAAVGSLVAGFVAVAARVGLWSPGEHQPADPRVDLAQSSSECLSGIPC